MVSAFTSILIVALIVWLILRLTGLVGGDGDGDRTDPAATIRRVFLYGLLLLSVFLIVQGAGMLTTELVEANRRSNAMLAQAISFLVVGIPATLLLGWFVDRRLREQAEERRALTWTLYLNAALATAVVGFLLEGRLFLTEALRPSAARSFEAAALVTAVLWMMVWAVNWFVLKERHGITGDVHLAAGTIAGLISLVVGFGGLVRVGTDELYNALTDDPITARPGGPAAGWVAMVVLGGLVWGWYWVANFRAGPRTEVWYVTVVPVGALAGFVATIVGLAIAANRVAVWYLGDPDQLEAVRYFDDAPVAAGVVAAGLVAWLYHRDELGSDPNRGIAVQAYDYLLAMASLVTAVIGTTMLLVAAFDDNPGPVVNTVIAGVTMVAIGGPIWAWFWSEIERHRAESATEMGSPVRRVHLFSLFGVGGVTVLISGLIALMTTIEDALDGNLSRRTLHDARVALALLITVTGVAWYHFMVYRRERTESAEVLPPPSDMPHHPRRIVLVSADGDELATGLSTLSGAPVIHWHRTDGVPSDLVRADDLEPLVVDHADEDVLIVLEGGTPTVIPFVDHRLPS